MPLRLRGGRAPFVAIATFPPFQRGNLPRRRKQDLSLRATRSNLPGGCRSTEYMPLTFSVGYFAIAQYDVRSPIGTSCHFPRRRKQIIVFARKRSDEAISREGRGLRSIFSVLFQGDCRGTSCLAMTVEFKKCGGGKIASAALVRLRVKINIKLSSG